MNTSNFQETITSFQKQYPRHYSEALLRFMENFLKAPHLDAAQRARVDSVKTILENCIDNRFLALYMLTEDCITSFRNNLHGVEINYARFN